MGFLIDPFKLLYKNRSMIYQTTLNDIKSRYAGSFMGLAWAVIYPILFLCCYASVYLFIFRVQYADLTSFEYVVLIFCGLVPFIGFQDALASGTSCIVGNVGLMKNTLFPIELVPVKTILSSQTIQASGFTLIIISLALVGRLSVYTPLVLMMWLLQIMFNIGLIWILSSIDVIVRDLQNAIGIVILFLMMISPIAYPVDMVPPELRPFMKLNPLYYTISSYQDVLIFQRAPRPETFIPYVIMSFCIFIIGFQFFKRMKRVFVDNV